MCLGSWKNYATPQDGSCKSLADAGFAIQSVAKSPSNANNGVPCVKFYSGTACDGQSVVTYNDLSGVTFSFKSFQKCPPPPPPSGYFSLPEVLCGGGGGEEDAENAIF